MAERFGTITAMPRRNLRVEPLRSSAAVPLTRQVAFVFALDPTVEQIRRLAGHAGAARLAFNHHIGRVKANMDQRAAERSYGVPDEALTPALSWSKFAFINSFNAWKNGTAPDSPVNDDGGRGLSWRGEVSADVFECASVDAAQALANWAASRRGRRKGKPVGFPTFKAKHKTTRRFGCATGPGPVTPSRSGWRVRRRSGCRRWVRFGCTAARRRCAGCSRRAGCICTRRPSGTSAGRWTVTLTGLAAEFHHQRRSPARRHPRPAGLDRGVKQLAVIADDERHVLHVVEGVKALQRAQQRLRRANKTYSRTKNGSSGRRKARQRLTKIHARIAHLRAEAAHQLSHRAATTLTRLTVEDLNLVGMTQLGTLARAVADAGMGDLGRMLGYKARWYGCELIVADRWFASSKTCSGCGHVKTSLGLGERTYSCDACGLVLDRDVNAAINLARWPDRHAPPSCAAA